MRYEIAASQSRNLYPLTLILKATILKWLLVQTDQGYLALHIHYLLNKLKGKITNLSLGY